MKFDGSQRTFVRAAGIARKGRIHRHRTSAGDVTSTPSSGPSAQLCVDAHLANFGSYASPGVRRQRRRRDPPRGPREWDLYRIKNLAPLRDLAHSVDPDALREQVISGRESYRCAACVTGRDTRLETSLAGDLLGLQADAKVDGNVSTEFC